METTEARYFGNLTQKLIKLFSTEGLWTAHYFWYEMPAISFHRCSLHTCIHPSLCACCVQKQTEAWFMSLLFPRTSKGSINISYGSLPLILVHCVCACVWRCYAGFEFWHWFQRPYRMRFTILHAWIIAALYALWGMCPCSFWRHWEDWEDCVSTLMGLIDPVIHPMHPPWNDVTQTASCVNVMSLILISDLQRKSPHRQVLSPPS